ncbi:exodeoxyribonuclease V subunit beta [Candidatus Pandoraea novymonadis]|uniref:RecBCD enzyme subunit RecB n=1 Tax=Candidatus Pandoraea novymonadis TaxID=1808959 RepID=A0ABX5FD55_9BURK|nr:exodeoxyribonuclease V subunit beta [Candidatus Pandoraea novymonadis]PSB91680.1 RecBCD enzyme subunit RecB [Candidatus Pandoraea novymonadis]
MNSFSELNVFDCPLEGWSLIEASAGTGKTWNICVLYVRLLLEKGFPVEKILVVTFTNAATAELRDRIRSRLSSLVEAMSTFLVDGKIESDDEGIDNCDLNVSDDPLIARLIVGLIKRGELTVKLIRQRLQAALFSFDQAAIYTIHGFCQRVLAEVPFSAGLPFICELTPDDSAVRQDLAVDYWRTTIEPVASVDITFAAWLVDKKYSPHTLMEQLERRLKKPMAILDWPEGIDDVTQLHRLDSSSHMLANHYEEARVLWKSCALDVEVLMREALPFFKANIYNAVSLAQSISAWDCYFCANDPSALLHDKATLLSKERLIKGCKKGHQPPEHLFFRSAEALLLLRSAMDTAHKLSWLKLLRGWIMLSPEALKERKRMLRMVSFDDLLSNVRSALRQHTALTKVLRSRYPAALIDEFQDTEPLQFDIFSCLYGELEGYPVRGPMFMVGDPKQAIYSFRAADLHTYFLARDDSDTAYTLAVNQRSTTPMVAACNRFFETNPKAFILDGLEYSRVSACHRTRPLLHDISQVADFIVWTLPEIVLENEGATANSQSILTKEQAEEAASRATAFEIARLLFDTSKGPVTLGDRPLHPGDIAVIVQTHHQGGQIKSTLATYGIKSVELVQVSVFVSDEADSMLRVLQAIEAPGDIRALWVALSTELLGLDANALYRLQNTEASDEEVITWIERLQRYHQCWIEHGFAIMWRTFMRELGLAARLVASLGGERRLTNYMHLAELLQVRWEERPVMCSLSRWLVSQRVADSVGETQLRLESDQNLVQIVTVHKSKGLEYEIVFCPFLWDSAISDSSGMLGFEYHDSSNNNVIDFCENGSVVGASALLRREKSAEQVRLFYVALTRAVHRCYIVAGLYKSRNTTKEACSSMLNWLVAGAGCSFEDWAAGKMSSEVISAAWRRFSGAPIDVLPIPIAANVQNQLRIKSSTEAPLMARVNHRTLREVWRIDSFSGILASVNTRIQSGVDDHVYTLDRIRPDYDEQVNIEPSSWLFPHNEVAALPAEDILFFPRGLVAGTSLHRLFELADFQDPASWANTINQVMRETPPASSCDNVEVWHSMMMRVLEDTVYTEIRPNLRLADIGLSDRLTEIEFIYPAQNVRFDALRTLLKQHGYPDISLDTRTLQGYIKGFIDLVFVHEGRWWILDWKSNYLGISPECYGMESVKKAMGEYGYHLQYLLYTLALHRYLKRRLPNYDYCRDIAGSLYLFVRGVRPSWRVKSDENLLPAGVYFDKPTWRFVDALDRLFKSADSDSMLSEKLLDRNML